MTLYTPKKKEDFAAEVCHKGHTQTLFLINKHSSIISILSLYSPSLVLIPLPFDFGQDVVKCSDLWGDGVYLDTHAVRVDPRYSRASDPSL